jgi:hypothetical protein
MTAILDFVDNLGDGVVVILGILALVSVFWADPIGGRDE